MWLDMFGALGWLLAREPDGAASTVQEAYRYISIVRPSVTWFREVFQLAWPEVSALPVNQQARAVAFSLLERVSEAKAHFEAGFQYIREHFEGGEPPSEAFFIPRMKCGVCWFSSPWILVDSWAYRR
jgi:hypothetical protein